MNGPRTNPSRAPKPDPLTHHCDVADIDYSKVKAGSLKCETCGATWSLHPEKGWRRSPDPSDTHRGRRSR